MTPYGGGRTLRAAGVRHAPPPVLLGPDLPGEDGVDYLMFGEPTADGYVPPLAETIERLDWWSQIFEVPCIGYAAKIEDVGALCAAGADFVALGDAVWSDARGPAVAVAQAESLLKARPAS